MIEIKFADDKTKCDICKKYLSDFAETIRVYVAKDSSGVLGYCGFSKDNDKGTLMFSYVNDDSLRMVEDGLLRASLSYMYENGAKTACCDEITKPVMLKRLGFKKSEDSYILDLTHSFLTQGCGCKN